MNEITINLRALDKCSRNKILSILEKQQELTPDDDNYMAIITIADFNE